MTIFLLLYIISPGLIYFVTWSLYISFLFRLFHPSPHHLRQHTLCLPPRAVSVVAAGVWIHMCTFPGVGVPVWLDVSVLAGVLWGYILHEVICASPHASAGAAQIREKPSKLGAMFLGPRG